MGILHTFEVEPWLFLTVVAFISLSIGSFLNVVIYRLPVILERDWRAQCQDYLQIETSDANQSTSNLTLHSPASACPHCKHKIKAWENIPVLSYLLLKGKCSSCAAPISIRYPVVELLTAVLSIVVSIKYGVSFETLTALIFTWILIALALIDLDTQLLPDNLTLPLLWLGLFISLFGIFTDTSSSIIGAISGYMVLWIVFYIFKMITGKEGMGFGDFKLLAAIGAWVGWSLLPLVILISSVIGSIIGISTLLTGLTKRQQPIPFGPYLAIAGWVVLLWGNEINKLYLSSLY